jgi:uncharacterized membrane protein HdeD (DUF308 family)
MTTEGKQPPSPRGLVDQIVAPLLERAWWAIAFRGLLGIVIGIVALVWPAVTLAVLLSVLGVYFFMDGIFALVTAFHSARNERSWWPYVLEGALSIVVGILTFTHPVTIAIGVLILAAVRCFVTGTVEIATAIRLRRDTGSNEWLLWLAGFISIAFGVLLVVRPALGVLGLVWMVGLYTIAFGIIITSTAFRLRRIVSGRPLAPQPV